MAEFLFVVNPSLRRPGKQIGEPTSIEDDGFPWGSGERDTITVIRNATVQVQLLTEDVGADIVTH